MENGTNIIKLSNEAKNLIMEFYEDQRVICGGENVLEYIKSTEDGRTIILKEIECEEEEYDLSCIASKLGYILNGFGPCSSAFYEEIDLSKDEYELEQKYKSMSKEEYIKYVGGLFYLPQRAEEIYERLKEIEIESE